MESLLIINKRYGYIDTVSDALQKILIIYLFIVAREETLVLQNISSGKK